jgi:DNA-binding response OmpR family regulator
MVGRVVDAMSLPGAVVHHILVVDDDQPTALFLKTFLEANGYQVTVAKDGGQAHSCLVMKKPDFVILDAVLHGETGYEICDRIKQQDKAMPVLFLTGLDLEESRDLAWRVGCDGYLTKPFEPDLLLKSIKAIAESLWQKTHQEEAVPKEAYVRFHCHCGKKFKLSQAHRGKTMTCPECGEVILVPRHD